MAKGKNTVIHLEFRETGVHHYFGSYASIYELFDSETIGVSNSRLNAVLGTIGIYKNKIVIIRKGRMIRKPKRVK